MLDATSQISHGFQNSRTTGRVRMRRPRQFNDLVGTILSYDSHLAEAQELLQTLDKSIHAMAIAVFLYPEVGAMWRNDKGKLQPRTSFVLISLKSVFSVRLTGSDVEDATIVWRLPLTEVKRVLVKDLSVLVVTRTREELRELKMNTKEEAFLVYRKLTKSLEVDRSIDAFTPAKIAPSTVSLMEQRNNPISAVKRGLYSEMEKGVQVGHKIHHMVDKGKDELFGGSGEH